MKNIITILAVLSCIFVFADESQAQRRGWFGRRARSVSTQRVVQYNRQPVQRFQRTYHRGINPSYSGSAPCSSGRCSGTSFNTYTADTYNSGRVVYRGEVICNNGRCNQPVVSCQDGRCTAAQMQEFNLAPGETLVPGSVRVTTTSSTPIQTYSVNPPTQVQDSGASITVESSAGQTNSYFFNPETGTLQKISCTGPNCNN